MLVPTWFIEFYTDHRGKSPVVEFLDSLPKRERNDVRNTLRLLREFGVVLSMPHARPVKGHSKDFGNCVRVLFACSMYCARHTGLSSCTPFEKSRKRHLSRIS